MPMHKFMQCQVQRLSYLEGGYLHQTMEVPSAQEKSEQIFFPQPKANQFKFADWTRRCPLTRSSSSFSSSSAKQLAKQLAFSRRLPRIKSSQKKRKRLIFLPCIAVNQATSIIVATSIGIPTITKAADTIATIANHNQDIQHHNHPQHDNKDSKGSKSYKKKDDCKCNHFKKKSNKAMHIDQHLEKGVALAQDLLCALIFGLALAQAAGATITIT
jgi:hypothetical protein